MGRGEVRLVEGRGLDIGTGSVLPHIFILSAPFGTLPDRKPSLAWNSTLNDTSHNDSTTHCQFSVSGVGSELSHYLATPPSASLSC